MKNNQAKIQTDFHWQKGKFPEFQYDNVKQLFDTALQFIIAFVEHNILAVLSNYFGNLSKAN